MDHIGSNDWEIARHELALTLPRIEDVNASVICFFYTLAYFNPLKQWWSPLKYFLLWFAIPTTSMIDTSIAVALNKHQASTFKKLGKLMADNVPHNSSNCCNCYQRLSAKAKSTWQRSSAELICFTLIFGLLGAIDGWKTVSTCAVFKFLALTDLLLIIQNERLLAMLPEEPSPPMN